MNVQVEVERGRDHLLVSWDDGRRQGSCRFDHLPGTAPEYLGSADELLESADRRSEGRILDAVGRWAEQEGIQLGIWHDDEGIELLA